MFRMNFFVLGLCLVMNRDYLFYYFMPLISFWFTIIFIFVIVSPRVNSSVATTPTSVLNADTTTESISPLSPMSVDVHNANLLSCNPEGPQNADFRSVHARSSVSSCCLNTLHTVPSTSKSTMCIQAQSATSTPRSLHRYEAPASITEYELDRYSRIFAHSPGGGVAGSTTDRRGHHKARSVGTLSDVRQLMELTCLPRNPRSTRVKHVGLSTLQPWSEDWLRRLRALRSSTGWNDNPRRRPRSMIGWVPRFRNGACCTLRLADVLVVLKFVFLVIGIEVLNQSAQLFHTFFFSGPQRHLFELTAAAPNPMEPYGDDLVRDKYFWYRRWSLDRYSVIYGMLFALFCEWARRAGLINDMTSCDLGLIVSASTARQTASSGSHNSTEQKRLLPASTAKVTTDRSVIDASNSGASGTTVAAPAYPSHFLTAPFHTLGHGYNVFSRITCRRFIAISLTLLGIIGIGISVLVAFRCGDRVFCTKAHTFLCLIPILSYILVRNCLGILRRVHSVLFAWLGDISLELFIAQHHIWLSADGNGILVLLPGYPLLNLALISFVFVCVCHEVHQLTRRLQRFLVPDGALQAIRNLLLIGVILHGIMHSSWRFSG
ncbi:CAS1 domain-containing protein 1 [Fasciola gigantica]|uniref:CAS1 domain-containing protein 1 n=1 Tax=Fasciola gigantica TaxID=46835 RepID=A0A504YZM1_FASGI|nr:CAS1 domain-containing protein 1 [Fasciola gigantica]